MRSSIIIVLFISSCLAINFRNNMKQALEKGKSLYKEKFEKDKTRHFLGHDMSEYPGTNQEMRKIQAQKWQGYYDCLQRQDENLGIHMSLIPQALLAFEGTSVKFDCQICLSPAELTEIESVEWEWSHINSKYLSPVEFDEHTFVSPEEKSLQLYNVGSQHTGQYVCRLKKQFSAPYFLTVVNDSVPVKMVRPATAPKGPYSEPPWKIHPEIILDTIWMEWSHCSTCNLVGKRNKYGHCIIISLSNLNSSENTETEDIQNDNIIDFTVNSTVILSEDDLEFLKIFKYGIPCRSHILLPKIKIIKLIRERKSEIMTGYCRIKCPTEEIFVVKDKTGNTIESANNSAGIYSMLQGFPKIEPQIERRLQFEAAGSDIVLQCPGNLNTDSPIHWQNGGKNLIPSLVSKESSGRIFITITDKINIKKAKMSDSGIYSCWQDKTMAGTIRLVVEKRINLNFNHHIMLIGLVLILSTFLYVFIKVFAGRKFVKSSL